MSTDSRPVQTGTITSSTAQSLTDLGFTAAQVARANRVIITGSGGNLRYYDNGTTPTSSAGHFFNDGITYDAEAGVDGASPAALEMIAESASVSVTVELHTFV